MCVFLSHYPLTILPDCHPSFDRTIQLLIDCPSPGNCADNPYALMIIPVNSLTVNCTIPLVFTHLLASQTKQKNKKQETWWDDHVNRDWGCCSGGWPCGNGWNVACCHLYPGPDETATGHGVLCLLLPSLPPTHTPPSSPIGSSPDSGTAPFH